MDSFLRIYCDQFVTDRLIQETLDMLSLAIRISLKFCFGSLKVGIYVSSKNNQPFFIRLEKIRTVFPGFYQSPLATDFCRSIHAAND